MACPVSLSGHVCLEARLGPFVARTPRRDQDGYDFLVFESSLSRATVKHAPLCLWNLVFCGQDECFRGISEPTNASEAPLVLLPQSGHFPEDQTGTP